MFFLSQCRYSPTKGAARVDSVSWKTRFGDVIRPTHINHASDEMLTKGFRRYEQTDATPIQQTMTWKKIQ